MACEVFPLLESFGGGVEVILGMRVCAYSLGQI